MFQFGKLLLVLISQAREEDFPTDDKVELSQVIILRRTILMRAGENGFI